ncbi:hypothetical protein [Lysinibacillus agricola]|uniref:hypothetical protein n=1 Tax=Lysinibacillus agricola TaxID=2590012 RepID=UPI003C244BBA
MFSVRKRSANVAAATGFCLCESATTATMFYLCESATTATMFYLCESATTATTKAAHRAPPGSFALCESEATATNVLSARKRSDSNKAPSRYGNQPHVMVMSHIFEITFYYFRSTEK